MGRKKKSADSEFQSYTYIKNELKARGWNTSNPNRVPNGQLYTQQECLSNPEIASMWGKTHPEYTIKLTETFFWIIEAKPRLNEIERAFKEAKEDYGKELNKHGFVRAMIVSGVAGNDIDEYLVKNAFWVDEIKEFKPILFEGKEILSLLTPDIAKTLLEEQTPNLKKFDISDDELLETADFINKIFHSASIRKEKRATIIATMLLSLLEATEPNYNATPDVFVTDINSRAEEVLKQNGKGDFFKYIYIQLPEKIDAKNKFKEALVKAFFALRNQINIKAAMRAGSDILGRFYETFLKYGNGAKDLGIVLTPRHITEFAVKILNITHNDIVYDPTCGTGGFLVSSFYHVKRNSNPDQFYKFRTNRIFGIDQQSGVSTLAIVNMIFIGDGKNNIINDDCLARRLESATISGEKSAKFIQRNGKREKSPVTRVLMNPPFALRKSDEKEFRFIDHALEQMEDGGVLFSILPCSALVKAGVYKSWRKNLLEKNTLLSVITFVEDLFYPQAQPPALGIIIKKGISHEKNRNVLWIKIKNDGHRKIKGKRLKDARIPNELNLATHLIQSFLVNQDIEVQNIPEFQKVCPIDYSDDDFELVPEAYLDAKPPSIKELEDEIAQTIRDYLAFLITSPIKFSEKISDEKISAPIIHNADFKEINITDLFELEKGQYHVSAILDSGNIPLISCSTERMGIEGYFNIDEHIYPRGLTVACDGTPLTTFYQSYAFAAKDNVIICKPKKTLKTSTILFIATQLNRMRWRFNYGRKCYSKKFEKIKIFVPIKEDEVDEGYMEKLCNSCYGWIGLKEFMQDNKSS